MFFGLFLYAVLGLATISLAALKDPRVEITLTLQHPVSGIATTPEGRLWILFSGADSFTDIQVAEWVNNRAIPYPNQEWNNFTVGDNETTHFVRADSIRIGPDGALWVVDFGFPKLVRINVTTNRVDRIYTFNNATVFPTTLLDDVRFNPALIVAYLIDVGAGAIIVLNLASGDAIRVLSGDRSTTAQMPISAEGKFFTTSPVSPDGKYYYYQPLSGGMWRIETSYLNAALFNVTLARTLPQFKEPYASTPPTGGTAIDADGFIYSSGTDRNEVIKIAPNGTWLTFLQDPRFKWIDAMWVDTQRRLWMPAAELNKAAKFNNGTSLFVPPLYVFIVGIDVGPSPIDHA